MAKYTETTALRAVTASGATIEDGKMIVVTGALKGLTGCGAMDYLCNHCGYGSKYRVEKNKKNKA